MNTLKKNCKYLFFELALLMILVLINYLISLDIKYIIFFTALLFTIHYVICTIYYVKNKLVVQRKKKSVILLYLIVASLIGYQIHSFWFFREFWLLFICYYLIAISTLINLLLMYGIIKYSNNEKIT